MRLFIPLLLELVRAASPADLNRDILGTFIYFECIDDPEPAVPRTSVASTFNRFAQRPLAKWYSLDEESFVINAKPIVKDTHEVVMEHPTHSRFLENNIRPLRDQGLNDGEILDHLTRRYYRALQRIDEMRALVGRK
jgi:hypothetical protein